MHRRKINWGWGGCVFLAAAVILSAMILVQGGIVSRGGKFTALSPAFALVTFLIFGLIGIVFLVIWVFDRRKSRQKNVKQNGADTFKNRPAPKLAFSINR